MKITLTLTMCLLLAGCAATRSMYYNVWETVGYAKRERLVDNVKDARAQQVEAKQQFATTLEQFRSVVSFKNGSDLEKLYNQLNDEYEQCEGQADDVRSKIKSVKNVSAALFAEWKDEIGQIKDEPAIQQQSQSLYDQTYRSYTQMVSRMDAAAATMAPVLTKFKNRVLFIKHNLNAKAIAGLKDTQVELGRDIDNLLRQMEASIAEADRFIAEIQQ